MVLVLQSKRKENKLFYDPQKGEYIYFHNNEMKWRMKEDKKFFDYVKKQKEKGEYLDINICYSFPIYRVYSKNCEFFANEELKNIKISHTL